MTMSTIAAEAVSIGMQGTRNTRVTRIAGGNRNPLSRQWRRGPASCTGLFTKNGGCRETNGTQPIKCRICGGRYTKPKPRYPASPTVPRSAAPKAGDRPEAVALVAAVETATSCLPHAPVAIAPSLPSRGVARPLPRADSSRPDHRQDSPIEDESVRTAETSRIGSFPIDSPTSVEPSPAPWCRGSARTRSYTPRAVTCGLTGSTTTANSAVPGSQEPGRRTRRRVGRMTRGAALSRCGSRFGIRYYRRSISNHTISCGLGRVTETIS